MRHLDAADRPGLETYLQTRGWLAADEPVLSVAKAGEGNMNLALRVTTSTRSLIVKQGRPWVEKYPSIAAPVERTALEARWYELASRDATVAARMPVRIGLDEADAVLVLEDLGEAPDRLDLYAQGKLTVAELDGLVGWLRALHDAFAGDTDAAGLTNMAMRELNEAHIFRIPFEPGNGLTLDDHTPGLAALAAALQDDAALVARCAALGRRYLGEGSTLLHGDFYPGSWLRADDGTHWIIDPEFGFWGPPEFDLGVLLAHLRLSGQDRALEHRALATYGPGPDPRLVTDFAAVEVLRRMTGVSQLPLELPLEAKRVLVDDARAALLA